MKTSMNVLLGAVTLGTAMFVSGFVFPRRRLVRDDVIVGLVPMTVGRDGRFLDAPSPEALGHRLGKRDGREQQSHNQD